MLGAGLNHNDLAYLADLMQSGKVTPVIERRNNLGEVPDAVRDLETEHVRGKVVITVSGGSGANSSMRASANHVPNPLR